MKHSANQANCYDYPQYWDLAFRDETRREADFLEAVGRKYCDFPVHRLLEPACGGGRLVVEMAARGYQIIGFDINPTSIKYLQQRLVRRQLRAEVFCADMTDFRLHKPVDIAFNTFNSFRHLTSEHAAKQHLLSMAAGLRSGGIYVLGFHLLPPDADEACIERWTARHARTRVSMTLRVLSCDRRRRTEVIRFSMRVRSPARELKLRTDYRYRLYTASQFRRLLAKVPTFQLCDVYDFWYEIDEPLELDNHLSDTVFILRKR